MPALLSQELFQSVADHALHDVMPQMAGMTLTKGETPPSGEIYTVRTVFEGEPQTGLSLCADASVFRRLTQHITGQEQVSIEELADAAKELFNVFCGHVAVDLFHATKQKFRFQVPQFYKGRKIPDGHQCLFELNYCGKEDERVQVIRHAQTAPDLKAPEAHNGKERKHAMPTKLMVVDDSKMVHLEMLKLLEGTDYEVVSFCQDGESAIEEYKRVRPDLVTMDILMPGMDGLEAARDILKEDPSARIVMVSSLAYDDTFNEASQIGTKGFLYKPFSQKTLLEALEKALQDS